MFRTGRQGNHVGGWAGRALAVLTVAAVVPAVLVGGGTANAADARGWHPAGDSYCDDGDDGGCTAWSYLWDDEALNKYGAKFHAYGEKLVLTDDFNSGDLVAVLYVEGNGTAVYYGEEDHNRSFDEGLSYSVQVCIGSTSGTCGPEEWGTT